MPPRAIKGSNDLAQAVGALTLAARAEEDSKADALGLGAAKAHKEEERRKAEDKRRQDKKEAQRKLELETAAATAATTQQEAQLHEGLRGIRGRFVTFFMRERAVRGALAARGQLES